MNKGLSYSTKVILTHCPVCSGYDYRDVWTHPSGICNTVCLKCGHVYTRIRRADSEIQNSYIEYSQTYPDVYLKEKGNDFYKYAHFRFNFIKKEMTRPIQSLLEIGSGYGHFLDTAQDVPFRAGIEPSQKQSEFGRQHYSLSEVICLPFEKADPPPASWPKEGFDAICSFHVLEHVLNPDHFLSYVKSKLKTGGELYLAVPNLFWTSPDFIEYYFIYKNWHLNTFHPQSLFCLLKKHGFSVKKFRREPISPMLPNSLIIQAVKDDDSIKNFDHFFGNLLLKTDIKKIINTAESIHFKMDYNINYVKKAFLEWTHRFRKVAIYGGGIHTKSIMEAGQLDSKHVQVIIDDDINKWGGSINGVPIIGFNNPISLSLDVIVVSSLASESLILEKMESKKMTKVCWKGIYRDLTKPSKKEEK